jgi:hypothetical protein
MRPAGAIFKPWGRPGPDLKPSGRPGPDPPASRSVRSGSLPKGAGATEASRDDPGAGREDRTFDGRGELRAAGDARLGRDGGAGPRGSRRIGLRGRPDRPRAARRRHGRRGAAGGEPGRLLEPGAGACRAARAARRGSQHARRRRRRRTGTRAGPRPTARGSPRRRPYRAADRSTQRRLGVDRAGGSRGHDRRCPTGRHRPWRGRLRQRPRRGGHAAPSQRARPSARGGAVVGG